MIRWLIRKVLVPRQNIITLTNIRNLTIWHTEDNSLLWICVIAIYWIYNFYSGTICIRWCLFQPETAVHVLCCIVEICAFHQQFERYSWIPLSHEPLDIIRFVLKIIRHCSIYKLSVINEKGHSSIYIHMYQK